MYVCMLPFWAFKNNKKRPPVYFRGGKNIAKEISALSWFCEMLTRDWAVSHAFFAIFFLFPSWGDDMLLLISCLCLMFVAYLPCLLFFSISSLCLLVVSVMFPVLGRRICHCPSVTRKPRVIYQNRGLRRSNKDRYTTKRYLGRLAPSESPPSPPHLEEPIKRGRKIRW